MKAQQLTDPVTHHGEGPVWSDSWGGLRFVDMLAGDVLTLGAAGGIDRLHVGQIAAAVRPRTVGGAVIAVERGFLLEGADGVMQRLPPIWDDPAIRMNEGGCDPRGRFYCGSMAYDGAAGAGAMYRLDPDGATHTVADRLSASNGLEWSPDGSLAYYIDTATGRVDVLDDDGDLDFGSRRAFATITAGYADGLTVDADGGVWVALWGGSAVFRYTAGGVLDEIVELPVSQVTACTFGGADLTDLFITTSREGLAADQEPQAGAIFSVQPGVIGRSVRSYSG